MLGHYVCWFWQVRQGTWLPFSSNEGSEAAGSQRLYDYAVPRTKLELETSDTKMLIFFIFKMTRLLVHTKAYGTLLSNLFVFLLLKKLLIYVYIYTYITIYVYICYIHIYIIWITHNVYISIYIHHQKQIFPTKNCVLSSWTGLQGSLLSWLLW